MSELRLVPILPFAVDEHVVVEAARMQREIQRQIDAVFGIRQEAEAARQQGREAADRLWDDINTIRYPPPVYARRVIGDNLERVRIWVVNFHGQVLGRQDGQIVPEKIGLTMYVPKQDWNEDTGLLEVDWDWRAMQRGEKWCKPARKPWQERIER